MTSFSRILGQSWKVKFRKVKLLKFKTFKFDLKFCWNWSVFHYEKIMRFKKWPQLPGAGKSRVGHHHKSHTPTSPEAILLRKMAHHTKQIRRECRLPLKVFYWIFLYIKTCNFEPFCYVMKVVLQRREHK